MFFSRSIITNQFRQSTKKIFSQSPITSSKFLFTRFSSSNVLNPNSLVSTYSSGPVQLKFTNEHEWLSIHPDGTTFVGITTYAADALGDVTFAELPTDFIGELVTKGDTIGSVESVKSASEIYSPIDGEITSVNEALEEDPSLINQDPMGDGWIAKLKINMDELTQAELLSESDYVKLLEEHDE